MIYKIRKKCTCGFEYIWETSYKPASPFKCQRCGKEVVLNFDSKKEVDSEVKK